MGSVSVSKLSILLVIVASLSVNGEISSGGGSGSGSYKAAIQSRHRVKYIDVPSSVDGPAEPKEIHINSKTQPVKLLFKTSSSPVHIDQIHHGQKGVFRESMSQDQPQHLVHYVRKPIIQEVREMIHPIRKVYQQIHPVQSMINTLIPQGVPHPGPPLPPPQPRLPPPPPPPPAPVQQMLFPIPQQEIQQVVPIQQIAPIGPPQQEQAIPMQYIHGEPIMTPVQMAAAAEGQTFLPEAMYIYPDAVTGDLMSAMNFLQMVPQPQMPAELIEVPAAGMINFDPQQQLFHQQAILNNKAPY